MAPADPKPAPAPQASRPGRRIRRSPGHLVASASLREERAVAFLLALTLPLYVALRDGGLDLVVRHEAATALWWAMALALTFRLLPRARLTPPANRVLLLGFAVIAWGLLSLLWTDSVERTSLEIARDTALFALPLACLIGLNRETWLAAAAGLSAAALAIPALAVLTRLAPDLIAEAQRDAAYGGSRLAYPLDYWNAMGAWGAMAVGIGLGWSAHVRSDALRALALAAVPLAGVCVYLTYSRGGTLALAAGAFVAIALSRNRATVIGHALVALLATVTIVLAIRAAPEIAQGTGDGGVAGVALVMLAVLAATGGFGAATRRRLDRVEVPRRVIRVAGAGVAVTIAIVGVAVVGGGAGEGLGSADVVARDDPAARLVSAGGNRGELWGSALSAFAERPLGGLGPGTFEFFWQAGGADREQVRDAHSLYLETLAERGLPGFVLITGFLGLLLAAALAGRRAVLRSPDVGAAAGLIAAFTAFLVHAAVDWTWEATAVTVLALSAAAIVAAALAPRRERVTRSGFVRAGLVVAALALGALQIPALVSTERLRASQAALAGDLPREARRLADDAVEAEPWAATPYAWRSYLALILERPGAGRRDARTAIRHERANPLHRLQLARVEVARGDLDAALAALRTLARMSPGYGDVVKEASEELLEMQAAGPANAGAGSP